MPFFRQFMFYEIFYFQVGMFATPIGRCISVSYIDFEKKMYTSSIPSSHDSVFQISEKFPDFEVCRQEIYYQISQASVAQWLELPPTVQEV